MDTIYHKVRTFFESNLFVKNWIQFLCKQIEVYTIIYTQYLQSFGEIIVKVELIRTKVYKKQFFKTVAFLPKNLPEVCFRYTPWQIGWYSLKI